MTKWDLNTPKREPLSPTERKTVVAEATDATLVTRYAVLGTLYAGVSSRELAHLRPEMVRSTGENKIRLILRGPVKCRAGNGTPFGHRWRPSAESEMNKGCSDCDGEYDQFRARTVPVWNREAASAIETLLSVHDMSPAAGTLRSRISKLGEQCGVDRLTSSVLWHTYPVILAEQGFTRDEIANLMGYTQNRQEDINFSGQVGAYCEGDNPFICSFETADGDPCRRHADTGQNHCSYHNPNNPKCGALLDDGSRCGMMVSGPNEECHHHSSAKEVATCGAELDDGVCEAPVKGDNRCQYHGAD